MKRQSNSMSRSNQSMVSIKSSGLPDPNEGRNSAKELVTRQKSTGLYKQNLFIRKPDSFDSQLFPQISGSANSNHSKTQSQNGVRKTDMARYPHETVVSIQKNTITSAFNEFEIIQNSDERGRMSQTLAMKKSSSRQRLLSGSSSKHKQAMVQLDQEEALPESKDELNLDLTAAEVQLPNNIPYTEKVKSIIFGTTPSLNTVISVLGEGPDFEAVAIPSVQQMKLQGTSPVPSQPSGALQEPIPTFKKKRDRPNQLKNKNMTTEQIIQHLSETCASNIALDQKTLPRDISSCNALDSFLLAITKMTTSPEIFKKQPAILFETLHLATGTRTDFCQEILRFIIRHQTKEQLMADAVEFFQEAMNMLVATQKENEDRKKKIKDLEEKKQEMTIQNYDLRRKLTETSTSLLKMRQQLHENALELAASTRHLEKKIAETRSLEYRLQHLEKGQSSGDRPKQSIDVGFPLKSKPSLDKDSVTSPKAFSATFQIVQEICPETDEKPTLLETTSYSQQLFGQLESDVNRLRDRIQSDLVSDDKKSSQDDELRFRANFLKIQMHLNQVQVENKRLREDQSGLKAKFISKERLVLHLEEKVSQILVEKEEQVVRLKSEICLFQNKIDEMDGSTKKKQVQLKLRIEKEAEEKVAEHVKKLSQEVEDHARKGVEQKSRIDRLTEDYSSLQDEFQRYRAEKTLQEDERNLYTQEIEGKFKIITRDHIEMKQKMTEKLEYLENKTNVKSKENQTLFLRIKYLRQIAETLQRQKLFLMETLSKSQSELTVQMKTLSDSLLSSNNNKSYLVSVEKAVKQSRKMCDLGESALKNVQTIVQFFKIEKLYELVFETEVPDDLPVLDTDDAKKRGNSPEPSKMRQKSALSMDGEKHSIKRVQEMLESLKGNLDLPSNFKPKRAFSTSQLNLDFEGSPTKKKTKIPRNEEYYLDHCPLEMCSILLKFVVENLAFIGAIEGVEEIPHSISRLLYQANQKSDLALEREIFENFLYESKKIMDDDVTHLFDQVAGLKQLKQLHKLELDPSISRQRTTVEPEPPKLQSKTIPEINLRKRASITVGHLEIDQSQLSYRERKKAQNYNVLSMEAFRRKKRTANQNVQLQNVANQSDESDSIENELRDQFMNDLNLNKIEFAEYKEKSKLLQKSLAEKVVKLEETIDFLSEQNDERSLQVEAASRVEIQTLKNTAQQRELALSKKVQDLKERISQLEEICLLLETQQKYQQQQIQMQNSENEQLNNNECQVEKEVTRVDSDNQNFFKEYEKQLKSQIQDYETKLTNVYGNIKQFIKIRESTNGFVSLSFDANVTLDQNLVAYYLSKAFGLPKDKFRLVSLEKLTLAAADLRQLTLVEKAMKTLQKTTKDAVVTQRILFEICADFEEVERLLVSGRAAIRDGSSLLYDLQPIYFGSSLGQSGLATRFKIKDFHLIVKQGILVGGKDYVVTLLRCSKSPFVFMVVMLDLKSGEEFVLELGESDIFVLTEGDQGLLEEKEPTSLAQHILESLDLFQHDGANVLTVEHKVFFNDLWHNALTTAASNFNVKDQKLTSPESARLSKFDTVLQDSGRKNTLFNTTSFRDNQILKPRQTMHRHNKQECIGDAECQTDFQASILFDKFNTVFKETTSVSDLVEIELCVQQSSAAQVLMIQFTETRLQKSAKFCVFQNESFIDEDLVDTGSVKGSYLVHSECIEIQENYFVLVSVEKIQQSGLLVKMHDLKVQTTIEFYIQRKSNGHFSKLTATDDPLEVESEFRSLVLNLMYQPMKQGEVETANIVAEKVQSLEEKFLAEGRDPSQVVKELFSLPQQQRAGAVNKIGSLTFEAQAQVVANLSEKEQSLQKWRGLQEKGLLLYRTVLPVRCSFALDQYMAGLKSKENATQTQLSLSLPLTEKAEILTNSLISLYLKNGSVHIETCLFEQEHKILICSKVEALDLFGQSPLDLSFRERVAVLHPMLEKLFVVQDNDIFHLRVESDAVPVSQVKVQPLNTTETNGGSKAKQEKFSDEAYEERAREFQLEKDAFVESGRAEKYLQEVIFDDQIFEVQIYCLRRKLSKKETVVKRIITAGKTQAQIEQQKIANYIEEFTDFECFFIETTDAETEDLYYTLLDKRRISTLLSTEITVSWYKLCSKLETELIQYLFKHCQINKHNFTLSIQNTSDTSAIVKELCRTSCGRSLSSRKSNSVVDFPDSDQYVCKNLVFNEEFEFTEHIYDFRLFQITTKNRFQRREPTDPLDQVGSETLCYMLEIFCVSEPDVLYKFRVPVCKHDSVTDAVSFYSDVFNLIDHPFAEPGTSDTSESKQMFQKLFKQYIDNRLFLTIQETKFPSQLAITIVEPSSRLIWKTTYTPGHEHQLPAYFQVIDTGSHEAFLTSVLDQFQNTQLLKLPEEKQLILKKPFIELQEDPAFDFVTEHQISSSHVISIKKSRGKLNVTLFDPSIQPAEEVFAEQSYENSNRIVKTSEFKQGLHFVLNQIDTPGCIAKVLNLHGKSTVEKVVLIVKIDFKRVQISVLSLPGLQSMFHFKLLDTALKSNFDQTCQPHQATRLCDVKPLILDALKHLTSQHIADTVQNNYLLLLHNFKKVLIQSEDKENAETAMFNIQTFDSQITTLQEMKCASHQVSFQHKHPQGEIRTIQLHRKIFCDDLSHNIVVITASANVRNTNEVPSNVWIAPTEIETVSVTVREPAESKERTQHFKWTDVFSPTELDTINKRDLHQIKQLAKTLVEKKFTLKRQVRGTKPEYSFDRL